MVQPTDVLAGIVGPDEGLAVPGGAGGGPGADEARPGEGEPPGRPGLRRDRTPSWRPSVAPWEPLGAR